MTGKSGIYQPQKDFNRSEGNIKYLNDRISTVETETATHESRIITLEGDVLLYPGDKLFCSNPALRYGPRSLSVIKAIRIFRAGAVKVRFGLRKNGDFYGTVYAQIYKGQSVNPTAAVGTLRSVNTMEAKYFTENISNIKRGDYLVIKGYSTGDANLYPGVFDFELFIQEHTEIIL